MRPQGPLQGHEAAKWMEVGLEPARKPLDQPLDNLAVPFPVHARPSRGLDAPPVQLRSNASERHVLRRELLYHGAELLREGVRCRLLFERGLIRAPQFD